MVHLKVSRCIIIVNCLKFVMSCMGLVFMTSMVWYGIVEFNVPLDTV